MKRRQLLLLTMVVVGAVSCSVAAYVEHTGEWWRGQTLSAKYEYVGLTFDGKTVGSNLLGFGLSAQVRVNAPGPVSKGSTMPAYIQVDGGQLVDGLDRFYSDPRNVNIPVSKASLVHVYRIAGMPHDTLLSMIEEFRKPGC
jgi:hypothetical protein